MQRISKLVKTREFNFLLFTIMCLICEGLSSKILFYILLFSIVFKYSFLFNAIKLDKPSFFFSPSEILYFQDTLSALLDVVVFING